MTRAVARKTRTPPQLDPVTPDVRMDVPEASWTQDELCARARWEHEQMRHARPTVPRYWFLGKALLALQEQIEPGEWTAWCDRAEIKPDRWKRGRVLAMAFPSEEEMAEAANLPILAAVEVARQRLGLPPRPPAIDAKFRRWLKKAAEKAEARLDELPRVAAPAALRPLVAELTYRLLELDRACAAAELK